MLEAAVMLTGEVGREHATISLGGSEGMLEFTGESGGTSFISGMPRLNTTRLRPDGKIQTRHEEPTTGSHNKTEPTRQKPADTADTTRMTRL